MTAAGELSWELVLGAVWHIVRVLIDAKDWSHSFSAVGIADAQEKDQHGRKESCELSLPPWQ